MSQTPIAYVPTLGDHWLCTEWSTVRSRLRTKHGTKAEAKRMLYARVAFLTGRGWRVTTQKLTDDAVPGERRMLVRVVPPSEYAHCGESVIEYRSCGGRSWCDPCTTEFARQNGIEAPVPNSPTGDFQRVVSSLVSMIETGDDPERAPCNNPQLSNGVCLSCDMPLRLHMHRFARMAADDMRASNVSTSR